jgi:hypothetical protein
MTLGVVGAGARKSREIRPLPCCWRRSARQRGLAGVVRPSRKPRVSRGSQAARRCRAPWRRPQSPLPAITHRHAGFQVEVI